ncbi:hypothetical protein EZ456_04995 [Pedobacter psychrodurus]|uniref:Uncharacterized protein n=1 Tax=Pedobacter psychrodurus TaxID=2530456 RepID=A0A4R0PZQ8_9SPHI|nr:hypothetical protein [Pedobacter psychrodurus]TCD28741.1 hypothetical protein EZ456_04995 [Pedobacter psychrodurus]
MTWTQFIIYLSGTYFLYYVANLLFDYSRSGRIRAADNTDLIAIGLSSSDLPRKIEMKDLDPGFSEIDYFVGEGEGDVADSPIVESGGISIRELFELARDESIEYTRSVSF